MTNQEKTLMTFVQSLIGQGLLEQVTVTDHHGHDVLQLRATAYGKIVHRLLSGVLK